MARKIGFHIYTLRIKEKYQRGYETLSSVCGEFDSYELLAKGLRSTLESHSKDESTERMACMKKVVAKDRAIVGSFNAGHYGEAADIVDSISAATSYEKKTTDAEMIPCFFRLDIPADRDEALLILQRDNRVSCKAAFYSIVAPMIIAKKEELKVDITPLTNKKVFDTLVADGKVQRLRFIKMGVTDDFVDSYDKGHKEVKGSMELVVKARRGFSLPFRSLMSRWSNSPSPVRELYEVPSFDYDTVKVDVKIGNSMQTVDFGNRFSSPIIDLTKQVKIGSNGHPTFVSLVTATEKLATDQLSEMYD